MQIPKYKKGDKVRVHSSSHLIVREINEVRPLGNTWIYSLLNTETNEVCRVDFGSGGSKVDWQEERWLHSYSGKEFV